MLRTQSKTTRIQKISQSRPESSVIKKKKKKRTIKARKELSDFPGKAETSKLKSWEREMKWGDVRRVGHCGPETRSQMRWCGNFNGVDGTSACRSGGWCCLRHRRRARLRAYLHSRRDLGSNDRNHGGVCIGMRDSGIQVTCVQQWQKELLLPFSDDE
jgi:hypothetical protein